MLSKLEVFPDARESVEDVVAEGDKVAVRHQFRGMHRGAMGPYPPSNKDMVADLAIYRIADGKIAKAWVEWVTTLLACSSWHAGQAGSRPAIAFPGRPICE